MLQKKLDVWYNVLAREGASLITIKSNVIVLVASIARLHTVQLIKIKKNNKTISDNKITMNEF